MTQWRDRADRLCYDGESVVEVVEVGPTAAVVVTTHRVLAFTPESGGANYRAVERPNVESASVGSDGNGRVLTIAVQTLVVGVLLLAGGLTISLDDVASGVEMPSGTGAMGLGGLFSTMETMLDLMALLDDALLALGVLALAATALLVALYVRSRDRVLVLGVAGGGDLTLPAPADESVDERVEAVIRSESESGAGPDASPADGGEPDADGGTGSAWDVGEERSAGP